MRHAWSGYESIGELLRAHGQRSTREICEQLRRPKAEILAALRELTRRQVISVVTYGGLSLYSLTDAGRQALR